MAWIDVGTDEPRWVDDRVPGLTPSTEREGYMQLPPGGMPRAPYQFSVPGYTASDPWGFLDPQDQISALLNAGVPQAVIDEYMMLDKQLYDDPSNHQSAVRLQQLGVQIADIMDPNRGYDSMGSFFGDAAKGAAGMAGTLATNPAVLGALGGGLATGAFGGLGIAEGPLTTELAGEGFFGGMGGEAAGVAGAGAGGAAAGGVLGTGASETFGMTGSEGLYSGPEFQGAVPPQSTGPGASFDAFGNPVNSGGGYFPAGSAGAGNVAGGAAAGSALSRIIDGTGTTADWTQVLGTAGATALGMYSANQMSDTLKGLASQNRAERQPFLSAATNYLDPNAWIAGPGANFTQGTLQALSGTHGNPAGSPYSQQLATDAAMRNWMGGVNTLGSLGLGGQGIQANLGAQAAGADADVWSTLAGGVSDVVNPRRSLADLLRDYKTVI